MKRVTVNESQGEEQWIYENDFLAFCHVSCISNPCCYETKALFDVYSTMSDRLEVPVTKIFLLVHPICRDRRVRIESLIRMR